MAAPSTSPPVGPAGADAAGVQAEAPSAPAQPPTGDDRRRPRCLVLMTGSVAAIKARELVEALAANQWDVRVALSKAAAHFVDCSDRGAIPPALCELVATDSDEWKWAKVGDGVLHIELRAWADIAVVAPLSANTLAKVAHGLCDNLVTCVLRAWEWQAKPLVLCPAMNTAMWDHPLTQPQLDAVCAFSRTKRTVVVQPVSKVLACGDVGTGALAAPADIATAARQALAAPSR